MSNTELLPLLPSGFRWKVKHKRAWAFLALEKHRWFGGYRTVVSQSLNPSGMTMQSAIYSAADDIFFDMWVGK